MTKHLLLIALTGCATEVDLSSTELDLSKEDLIGDGYECEKQDPMGARYVCKKCWDVEITDAAGTHHHEVCNVVGCTGHPDGSSECSAEIQQSDGYWLEAESANVYNGVQKATSLDASAGAYVSMAGPGNTRHLFTAVMNERVYAWARVIAPSASAKYVELQLDSGTVVGATLPVSTTWTWVPLNASFDLSAGSHYFRIYTGEVGVKIDRIYLTPDPGFVPVAQTVQAESAYLVAPMRSATQNGIPPIGYVYVPNGATGSNARAQFQISVPYFDEYFVWGRFLAPTEADNSFNIGLLGLPPAVWSVPPKTTWQWNRASRMFELGDWSVLDLTKREDGTKLDKLVLTNDPGFTLVDAAPPINAP